MWFPETIDSSLDTAVSVVCHVGFYNFISLWSPETIDNCWDTAVSVVVCRDPWLPPQPPGNYDGQNSLSLAPTVLVSITFLVYGPQKQLIIVWTRLFLLFAEIYVCYQSPRILWCSEFTRYCSNRIGFYSFFSLWSPLKQLIAVETQLFLLLFAEIHVTRATWRNYDGQSSHALAPTALVSITFLVYGPQKSLITVETGLFLLLFAEIHVCYQSPRELQW